MMITKPLILALLFAIPRIVGAESEKEWYDFNFDGRLDYRVPLFENARGTRFDVFLFDPTSSTYLKDQILSGTVYPTPDPKTKRVLCIGTGGEAGAVFSGTVYVWNGKEFQLAFAVRQVSMRIDGKIYYIRAKAETDEGTPQITSIELGDPHWGENGIE